jgi:hypothetical protein
LGSDCILKRTIDISHIKELKNIVIVTFKIRFIDEWTETNNLEVLIDEKVVRNIKSATSSDHLGHKCGDPRIKDGVQEISINLNLDSSIWNLKIREIQPGPIWGIFDFEVWTSVCPENSVAISKEKSLQDGCICNEGFYPIILSNIFSCVKCSHGCISCSGPDTCSACIAGYTLTNQKCLVTG